VGTAEAWACQPINLTPMDQSYIVDVMTGSYYTPRECPISILLPFAEELVVACFSNKISHFDEQPCVSNISTKTQ
jgi:hypothetical protein